MTKNSTLVRKLATCLLLATTLTLSPFVAPNALAAEQGHVNRDGTADAYPSVDEAWKAAQSALAEIEKLVAAKDLRPIHVAQEKIAGALKYIQEHPPESADKPRLDGAIKNAISASEKLHTASDGGDQAKTESALKTLKTTLTLVEKQLGSK